MVERPFIAGSGRVMLLFQTAKNWLRVWDSAMRLPGLVAFASCVLLLTTAPGLAEQKLALVIGNDDYAHVSRLERAVGDAKAVEAAFERLGFAGTLVTNVDLAQFAKIVAQFEAKIQPGDIVALHYSGH